MKRLIPFFSAAALLISCAPRTTWEQAEGRDFEADMRECEHRATLAVPRPPSQPYQAYPKGMKTSEILQIYGQRISQSSSNLGNYYAQKELYVNTCMEQMGHDLIYLP